MCGIAGFVSAEPVADSVASAMLDGIRQRGPDTQHIHHWGAGFNADLTGDIHAALIHSRLSIRDLSDAANQPMSNDNRQVWLCYNGEVYDWEKDAKSLAGQGFVFKTHSDTEYILNAYLAYGFDAMLQRLRGMFAFAILDLRQQKIYLARDRMGLKPLLFHHDAQSHSFAFGSTVRSVAPFLPMRQRAFSAKAIDAYLAHRYIPAPLTIFESIQRLENASCLTFDLKTYHLTKRTYWRPTPGTGEWKTELDSAIQMRTVADRPIGVFLSAGIDSSTVTERLQALGFDNLTCFSAAFPGSSFDESKQAAEFAAQLGLPHQKVAITDALSVDFDQLIADLDEPFADPSSIPSWYLSRETAKSVAVVLGGDGGDELFAGYKRYQKHLRSMRRFHLPDIFQSVRGWSPKGWRKWLVEASLTWQDAYAFRFSGLHVAQRRFLQPDLACQTHYWRQPETQVSGLQQLLEIDRLNYLPEYILRKADLCTMAHGLEQRTPLLDHHFYQEIIGLSPEERFTQPPKKILGKIAPGINPIFSRKKRGFNPPLTTWLQRDLSSRKNNLGQRLHALTHGQIQSQACDSLIEKYYAGLASLAEQVLQLFILDESLRQLNALRQRVERG